MLNPRVPLTPRGSLFVARDIVLDSPDPGEPSPKLRYERDYKRRVRRLRAPDQWQRPEQTDALGVGDCEDLMIGPNHLNWPGSVYLTDGAPDVTYQVETAVRKCPLQYGWHPLSQLVSIETARIPMHHSRIRASRPVTVHDQAGFPDFTLDHEPIPCTGDNLISFAFDRPFTLISEWWG